MADLLSMTQNPAQYANIPLAIENPMDQAIKAATLRSATSQSFIEQNNAKMSGIQTQDALDTRDAVAGSTSIDPNTGQPVTDINGAVKNLSAVNPNAGLQLRLGMAQRSAEVSEKQAQLQATQLANTQAHFNLMGAVANSIHGQADLDRVKANASALGLDASKIPDVYDAAQIQQFRDMSQKVGETISNKIELARLGLTAAKQTKEIQQMDATATNEITGQYKDDPNTKNYVSMANTYQSFKAMQGTDDFSAGLKDRDLVYNFQNIINPNRSATGSTTEQDSEATRSLQDELHIHVTGPLTGAVLTPSQRSQISSFIEDKYKDATLSQQVVYNNYQKRLLNMRAQGREVDPVNSLPEYGATIGNGKSGKTWVGVHNAMSTYAPPKPVTPYQNSGTQSAADISNAAAPSAEQIDLNSAPDNFKSPTPPPAGKAGEQGKGFMTQADIAETARASGKSEADIRALATARGYQVE